MAEATLFASVTTLRGISTQRGEALEHMGIETIYDLLHHFPRSYVDYAHPVPVMETQVGETQVVRVRIMEKLPPQYTRNKLVIYKAIARDETGEITVVFYNTKYAFQSLPIGGWVRLSGKIKGNMVKREIHAPQIFKEENPHVLDPVYRLTNGISASVMKKAMLQAIQVLKADPITDPMPETIRQAHHLMPEQEALTQIHFPNDIETMEAARRRLSFDELLDLQLGMQMRRAANQCETAQAMSPFTDLTPYYHALPFTMTEDQKQATQEICHDLTQSVPMNRLLQGDVGSGKTAVAAAACYFTISNHLQCALMAPTEILATQHMRTMQQFLEPFGFSIALLTGATPAKEKRQIYADLENGTLDMVVGTHAIFQKDVHFYHLALVITDEQHRFGVNQRALLAEKGGTPHKLVMSATPIPRTLALMIYGDLDISVLRQMPAGRLPVQTYAVTGKLRTRVYTFIQQQLEQGHQGYIVCPMVNDEEEENEYQAATSYVERIREGVFQNYRVGLLHGQMKAADKDDIMASFHNGDIDLLVCTTVIEVGVDVPNATIMLIEDADRFGLSQLHQLRGRVGRGDAQSYCILMTDHPTEDVKTRLQILSQTTDGFAVAEADLQLRGPGDFFGEEQHGLPPLQIADLTHDTALVQEVQDVAREILAEDPNLSQPQHRAFSISVQRLFRYTGDNSLN